MAIVNRRRQPQRSNVSYERELRHLRMVSFAALTLAFIALVSSIAIVGIVVPRVFSTISSVSLQQQPQTSVSASAPSQTLAGIDTPLNSTELAVINNGPDSYYETAGEMYLNGSIADPIFSTSNKVAGLPLNGKPSMIYLGSITCIFCGENRWAMALALSRFGSFSQLFNGYSSLGDGDVPTLYWSALNYNVSGDSVKNYYSSSYINFITIEDINPITGGFDLNQPTQIIANLNSIGNQSAILAFNYIMNLSTNNATAFKGTPYTIWGNYQFAGADAEVFGNSTPTSDVVPLSYMTHAQVLSELAKPSSQFAWSEYAAADIYISAMCSSLNNTAPVCSLPAIQQIENLK